MKAPNRPPADGQAGAAGPLPQNATAAALPQNATAAALPPNATAAALPQNATAAALPPRALLPMTVSDVDAVMAVEARAYSFPWSRGNFIDSLAAERRRCGPGTRSRCRCWDTSSR
jgi:hypothetical protein